MLYNILRRFLPLIPSARIFKVLAEILDCYIYLHRISRSYIDSLERIIFFSIRQKIRIPPSIRMFCSALSVIGKLIINRRAISTDSPLPLRAGTALLEARDLYDVEEECAEGVGDLGVDGLQAPAELGVAVAVRARERRGVADPVDALLRRYRHRAVVVLPAAGVLGSVVAQVFVRLGDITRAAPFSARVHDSAAWSLVLRIKTIVKHFFMCNLYTFFQVLVLRNCVVSNVCTGK